MKTVLVALLTLSLLVAVTAPANAQMMLLVNAALGKKPYKQTAADKRTEAFFAEKDRWSH